MLSDSQTIRLNKGEPAPWDGWLLTDGAMVILLEEVERCQQ